MHGAADHPADRIRTLSLAAFPSASPASHQTTVKGNPYG